MHKVRTPMVQRAQFATPPLLQTNINKPIFGKNNLNILVPKIPDTQGHGIFQPRTGHNQAIFQWTAQTHMLIKGPSSPGRKSMELAHRKQTGGQCENGRNREKLGERRREREKQKYKERHTERRKLKLTAIVGKHSDAENWLAYSEVQATTPG